MHREVINKPIDLSCIRYSDGTTLSIEVRKAAPRERVEILDAYGSLIRQAILLKKSYVTVDELVKKP